MTQPISKLAQFMSKSAASLSLLVLLGCSQNQGNATDTSSAAADSTLHTPTSAPADANIDPAYQGIYDALTKNMAAADINLNVSGILPTSMPDMYVATIDGMAPIFVDKTGKYIIQGEIVELGGARPKNITSELQATLAKAELTAVPEDEMIIFPAKGETKATIYVFSDPTCHYCQLLHKEIDQTNSAGVEVRYLAWPRSDHAVPLAEAVWCSADRNTALTDAKLGKMPTASSCSNPVQKHMALGHKLGVAGTPAVFTQNGEQIGGYLPSADLAKVAIESANAQ